RTGCCPGRARDGNDERDGQRGPTHSLFTPQQPGGQSSRSPRTAAPTNPRGSVALTHLVDTSVFTRLGNPAVRSVVDPLAHAGVAGRAGITDLEIGCGSRNATEWEQDMADVA